MEETTTETPQENGVEASTQPVQSGQSEAVQPQEPAPNQEAQTDEVMEWVSKKGYDLSTPEGVKKLAQSYRESEKLAMTKAQEASELKKSLDQTPLPQSEGGADPMMAEFISDYRRDKMLNNFKASHPDWHQYDGQMGDLLSQPINTSYGVFTRAQLVDEGLISLDEVYLMAKGSSPVDTSAVKAETQKEVLQTLANTQRAGGAIPNASNPNPKAPEYDPIMEGIKKARAS